MKSIFAFMVKPNLSLFDSIAILFLLPLIYTVMGFFPMLLGAAGLLYISVSLENEHWTVVRKNQ